MKKLNGLASFTIGSATCKPLTPEDFQKTVDYFCSDEYFNKQLEKEKRAYDGQRIVMLALDQGIITMPEALMLLDSIAINGYLLVSPKMHKRLIKVKE